MKTMPKASLFASLLGAVLLAATGFAKPNIIVVMADDLGMGDVSYTGGSIRTPNIDQLAADGMHFTDFHSNGAMCSPTRAAFLTGRYQQRCGVIGIVGEPREGKPNTGLGKEEFTFADALKAKGYATALFGKWHVGHIPEYHPINNGFDEFVGNIGGCIDYFTHTHPRQKNHDWWNKTEEIKEEGYTTHLITRHSVDFIKRRKDGPFCLFVSYTAPHTPLQGPDPTKKQPKEEAYPEMIQEVDKGVGEIVAALQDAGIGENTFLVFTADNGHSKHSPGSALGFREMKGTIYEGGHRVPTIFKWPGRIEAGTSSDQTAMSFDLMPTMLELAGANLPEGRKIDGISLAGHLLGNEELPHRILFWDIRSTQAVRSKQWKLILDKKGKIQLYNLQSDPGETKDVAENRPELTTELLAAVEAWKDEMGIQDVVKGKKKKERDSQ